MIKYYCDICESAMKNDDPDAMIIDTTKAVQVKHQWQMARVQELLCLDCAKQVKEVIEKIRKDLIEVRNALSNKSSS